MEQFPSEHADDQAHARPKRNEQTRSVRMESAVYSCRDAFGDQLTLLFPGPQLDLPFVEGVGHA
jgi:hypothetical protein